MLCTLDGDGIEAPDSVISRFWGVRKSKIAPLNRILEALLPAFC